MWISRQSNPELMLKHGEPTRGRLAKITCGLPIAPMLELCEPHDLTPDNLRGELRTARRILSGLTAPADRRSVAKYIAELEDELGQHQWPVAAE